MTNIYLCPERRALGIPTLRSHLFATSIRRKCHFLDILMQNSSTVPPKAVILTIYDAVRDDDISVPLLSSASSQLMVYKFITPNYQW